MTASGPIPRTIRELRAEVRALRTEVQELNAKNQALAEDIEVRDHVLQLEKTSRDLIPPMLGLPLTKSKRRLLGILYRHADIVPRERLNVLMWGVDSNIDPKGLDVHISQLRHMVEPHSITIDTIYDVGYRLSAESRPRVASLIERQARAAINPMNGTNEGERHVLDARS